MATPPKERKQDMCPSCYLEKGIDEPLMFRLGTTQPLACGKGHKYDDREELSFLTNQMAEKRRSLLPKEEKPIPTLDESVKDIVDPTDPIDARGVKGMHISPVDFVRISSLIGHFTDSSSLFGAVFALNQDLADTKALLQRSQDARAVSKIGSGPGVKKLSGDLTIELTIPERHVGPIKDIAESNGMDPTRYMNAKVEDGLDAYWYY